jgi:hypothetical protein
MFSLDECILVNQWVQGIVPTFRLVEWFETSSDDGKSEILRQMMELCRQAKAAGDDGSKAVAASGINPRRTTSVLLSLGTTVERLHQVVGLTKSYDRSDAFVLLLHLLKVADDRRRANEAPGLCTHWWHRDLGNPRIVEDIRKAYSTGRL